MPPARQPARRNPPREKPPFVVVSEWPIFEMSGWTLEQVQAALDQLGRGSLHYAERLLQALEKDPAFLHGSNVRCETRVTIPLTVEWPLPDLVPEQLRADLEAHLDDIWGSGSGPNALATLTRYRVALGVAPAAVTWDLAESGLTWLPTVHAKEAGWLTYHTTDPDDPTSKVGLYEFQTRDGDVRVIPDGKAWLLFSNKSGSYPHQRGILRALAAITWMKQAVIRWWGIQYNKSHGNPYRLVRVPGKQRESYDAEKFAQKARAIIGGDVIVCPDYGQGEPTFDFKLVEAQGRSWETFPNFLDYCDKWITLLWLWAWDQTQGDAAGSRARAEVHERVGARATLSDCTTDSACMRPLARAWCEYNGIPREAAPKFCFVPPKDPAEEAATSKTQAEALEKKTAAAAWFEQRGHIPDYAAMARDHGIPIKEVRDVPIPPPLPEAPPTPVE